MASSISTSQALSDCTDNKAQPHCLDNNDSDDETDEEENFSSLQPKVATNPLGKIVQEARKRHNYSSDSIENLIELWRKDNDISHLKRILEQDPSCLLTAVAKKDCDLIKGFLKAGAQAEKLGQEWRQNMNQLLLQNAVKCCKDSKIDKAQQVEALRTIITLDPQYLCTAVRNHKKDEDNSFIEALIASNANVHCNLKNKTPLDIAVMEGHYTCIQPLLAAKAQMTRGKHPIVWWIDNITEAKRKITIAKDTNIFINIFTQNELNSTMILSTGNTFLHHAASKGASAILLALLDYKADPHLVNHSGKTPRAFAYTIQSDVPGKDECIKILEKAMGFREKDN
jgi:ankyrin repeat protein